MIILGLTGSIGMGKSTTAKLFQEAGVPVYDADATVHMIYEGEAAPAIEAAFPGTTVDGKVDRAKLSARVVHDAEAMKRLERELRLAQKLDLVNVLIASVVASTWIALRVFVRHRSAEGIEDGAGGDVLGGDE